MKQLPVSLQDLTASDKEKLMTIVQRKLILGLGIFLLPFLIIMGFVIYANNNVEKLGLQDENVRGTINLVGVLVALLFLRFFANLIIDWRKASSSWQKKIIRGEITGKKRKTLYIAGQEINTSDFNIESYQPNDEVLVEVSVAGEHILLLQKLSSAAEKIEEK